MNLSTKAYCLRTILFNDSRAYFISFYFMAYDDIQKNTLKVPIFPKTIYYRVGPTGFLQSDDDAKLKIDEF